MERQIKDLHSHIESLKKRLAEKNVTIGELTHNNDLLQSELDVQAGRRSSVQDGERGDASDPGEESSGDAGEALRENDGSGEEEDDDEMDTSIVEKARVPLWDTDDKLWRCSQCLFELWDGSCYNGDGSCGLTYDIPDHLSADSIDCSNEAGADGDSDSYSELYCPPTAYKLTNSSDRQRSPRSNTPLLDVPPILTPQLFSNTSHTPSQFHDLLARGATPAMIATYRLEYTSEGGIVAWATEDVYNAFAGERMKDDDDAWDRWMVCLGRRLKLEPEDTNGSGFVFDLLDAVARQQRSSLSAWRKKIGDGALGPDPPPVKAREWRSVWRTYRNGAGVWITRPPLTTDQEVDDADGGTGQSDEEGPLKMESYALQSDDSGDELLDDASEEEGLSVDWDAVDESGYPLEWDSDEMEEEEGDDEVGSDWDSDEVLSGDEGSHESLTSAEGDQLEKPVEHDELEIDEGYIKMEEL